MKKLLLLFLPAFIVSCGNSVPSDILDPKEMYPVVKDIMIADEYINNTLTQDSTVNIKRKRIELYQQIFALHKTDKKQFYSSFKYYQHHPDLQKELFDSLSESLKRKELSQLPPSKEKLAD